MEEEKERREGAEGAEGNRDNRTKSRRSLFAVYNAGDKRLSALKGKLRDFGKLSFVCCCCTT